MGTLAGNLMIKHKHKEFPSDIYITFIAINVQVNVIFAKDKTRTLSMEEFLATNMRKKVILSFELPKYPKSTYLFNSYKVTEISI